MLQTFRVRSLLAFFALGLFLLVGCVGQKVVTVKGTMTPPANVKFVETDTIHVTFAPETGSGGVTAKVSPSDQSFTAKGVVVGKNKVSVLIKPYQGAPGSKERTDQFVGFNKYYNTSNTKLTYDAGPEPEQSITIDLIKGTIAKK